MRNENREAFESLARLILDGNRPAHSLGPQLGELTRIIRRTASVRIHPGTDIADGETSTDRGVAVSPTMAAMCADDLARTVLFMRGLQAAVHDRRECSPQTPAHVLYCGCGPYALLALPLMATTAPDAVRFTLLDIHERSVDSARRLIDDLDFADHVLDCRVMDAGHYQVQPDQVPDVIVMEIMRACLEKEPQVAIARHLLRQAPGALLVPQSVRIEARLVKLACEFSTIDQSPPKRDRIPLGTVFELSTSTIETWGEPGQDQLPASSIEIPPGMDDGYDPMLFTIIQVYGEWRLSDYDSGLTVPRPFPVTGPLKRGGRVNFTYRLGHHPQLVGEQAP